MKTILVLLDGLHQPVDILRSVANLARTDSSFLHILILRRSYLLANLSYPLGSDLPLMEKEQEEDQRMLDNNLEQARVVLAESGLKYALSEEEHTLSELLKQSAFADLVLMDARISLSDMLYFPLNVSFKDLLADAHCPVIVLRDNPGPIEKVMLAYDGSYSSIYAIKLFSYLFPQWRSLPTYLVTVQSGERQLTNDDQLKEWWTRHFDRLELSTVPGKPSDTLPDIVNKQPGHTIVVMGAYGRTAVSRLFRQSLSNTILQKTNASLFVTHE